MKSIELYDVKRNTGLETDCIFAKAKVNGNTMTITYDCIHNNVIVHEWYMLSKCCLEELIAYIKKNLKLI